MNNRKTARKRLKLFVWTHFCPDCTDGLAFAIARDEQEAQAMIEKEYGGLPIREWGYLNIYPTSRKIAACVSGGG